MFQNYRKFESVSLDHFKKCKSLITEECKPNINKDKK